MNRITSQAPGGTMRFAGSLSEAASVTIQGSPATVTASNSFAGGAPVSSGTSQVVVTATDPAGNQRTNTYQVSVSGSSKTFTFDANGNVTGDGTRTFEWDAENRLLAVNQGTLRSEFSYDHANRRVRIVEKNNGAVTSERRLLWCEHEICEERNSSGATVVKRYYVLGVEESGVPYFHTTDHLGSVREMLDGAAAVRARYEYDAFGRQTKVSGDKESSFGFTGFMVHSPSNLSFAVFRAYDADSGRWINTDPIGLRGGVNLYSYVLANPVRYVDVRGLKPGITCFPPDEIRECLANVFDSDLTEIDDVRVEAKPRPVKKGDIVATTRRNHIRLRIPCVDFWTDPFLVLHEYYHVLKQWNTGRMTHRNYIWEEMKRGPNRWEEEADNEAEERLERYLKCLEEKCSGQ